MAIPSSAIFDTEYDPKSMILTVHFKKGGTYKYRDVPKWKHSALQKAASMGGFLNTEIIPKHPAIKM